MQLRMSHVVIRVRDLDAMVGFYRDVLGFKVSDEGHLNGVDLVFMTQVADDHHQIAFGANRTDGSAGSNTLAHVAFRVGSIADVREVIERLEKDERVAPGIPLTHGNAISVYFDDPEGNGVEVLCDTPWHVNQPMGVPWDPSKSDDEVLREVEEWMRDKPGFQPIETYRAEVAKRYASP